MKRPPETATAADRIPPPVSERPAKPDKPATSLRAGAVTGQACRRCGVPFAWTTPDVLARCTGLARAGQVAS